MSLPLTTMEPMTIKPIMLSCNNMSLRTPSFSHLPHIEGRHDDDDDEEEDLNNLVFVLFSYVLINILLCLSLLQCFKCFRNNGLEARNANMYNQG
jgi:hypothetical protein